jgi:hypothetical protein
MAMATTSHPEPNPQMHPAPDAEARNKAAQEREREREKARRAGAKPADAPDEDVGEPFLSDDDESVDWVQLLRCYPNARSKDELRGLAMTAGKEALVMAAQARANKDLPIPGLEMSDKPEPDKPAPPPPPPPPPPPHEPAREAHR